MGRWKAEGSSRNTEVDVCGAGWESGFMFMVVIVMKGEGM